MTRLWIRDPIAVLADGAPRGIVIEGSRIVELVGPPGPQAGYDAVFEAGRHVVIPGLVNAHHHFFQTLTRAHPRGINKKLFDWLEALYPIWARHLDADLFRLGVRLALTELLMSGCTTASDHHFLYPPGLDDAVDIEDQEAATLGMRMTLTRGTVNLRAQDGGIADDRVIQDDDVILADCERVLARYHDPADGSYRQVALAPCAPFNVTRRIMIEAAALAGRHDCRLHTHLGETRDENDYCQHHFNCRPVDYLEEVGWMQHRVWLAHGIHFNDAEIARLGRHHVGVCHCPTSNMVLASGQCRTNELEAAGAVVGLGVDGSASNDNSNLMESVRHALMLGRLTYGTAAVTHLDAFRWATDGSARCLGRSDVGAIAVGRQADLALFTLDELRFSGAGDPIAALVLCGAHRADRVMIGGTWRVIDGAPLGVDVERLRHEHGRAAKRFLEDVA
jgi:8-oxoguanine deaminase